MRSDGPSSARFSWTLPYALADFPYNPPPYGGLSFRFPMETTAEADFARFADRVTAAVGREYLPVFRMADGEFIFMVGEQTASGTSRLVALARKARNRLTGRTRTCWGEEYSRGERRRAVATYQASLRKVAAKGVIAAYFAVRADGWGAEYWTPVTRWLDRAGVRLDASNYVPFYSVYALLNGPRRRELYDGRRVLVITHLQPARERSMRAGLMAEGVSDVQFLPVSPNKAMLDTLALDTLRAPVDLVLIAAGIGSVNLLAQCEPLGVPAIDCGIALDCLIDPQRRWERPFLIARDRADEATMRNERRF